MMGLSLAHMRERPFEVSLAVLLIGFVGALLICLASLSNHVSSRLAKDSAGIDLVVSAKGSPLQVILSSVFHVDVPTGNIPYHHALRLPQNPLVAKAIPIAIGDSFRGYRVVGTTPDYAALYGAQTAEGVFSLRGEDAVIGAAAAKALGLQLGQRFAITHGLVGSGGTEHDNHPLTVKAILKPTGRVIDRLILTSIEAVWNAHGIEAHADHAAEDHIHEDPTPEEEHDGGHDDGHEHDHEQHHEGDHDGHLGQPSGRDPEITAVLIKYNSPLAAVRLPGQISAQPGLMAAVPAMQTARLLDVFGASQTVIRSVLAALGLLGAFGVFSSLWSTLASREKDIALYRLMGAQPSDIFKILSIEGLVIAAIGALAAVLIAKALLWQLSIGMSALAQSGLAVFKVSQSDIVISAGIVALGAICALPAAFKAARIPLERALD